MPTGSRRWRHIRYGFRLCLHRCPCRLWWRFSVKQWPNYSTLCLAGPVLRTFVQYLITFCSRPEADNDVISGTAVDNVGVDVPIKFGDYRPNGFRDIRGINFVSNERNEHGEVYRNSRNAKGWVSPKNRKRRKKRQCTSSMAYNHRPELCTGAQPLSNSSLA